MSNKRGSLKYSQNLLKKEIEIMNLQDEGIFGLEEIYSKNSVRQYNAKSVSVNFTHLYSI